MLLLERDWCQHRLKGDYSVWAHILVILSLLFECVVCVQLKRLSVFKGLVCQKLKETYFVMRGNTENHFQLYVISNC